MSSNNFKTSLINLLDALRRLSIVVMFLHRAYVSPSCSQSSNPITASSILGRIMVKIITERFQENSTNYAKNIHKDNISMHKVNMNMDT